MAGPDDYANYTGLDVDGDLEGEFLRQAEINRLARQRREEFWQEQPADVAPPPRVRALNNMTDEELARLTDISGEQTRAAQAAIVAKAARASYLPVPSRSSPSPSPSPSPSVEDDNDPVGLGLQKFLGGYDPFSPMEPGSGVRLPGGSTPTPTPPTPTPTPSNAGQVDVTIDGKVYHYGGGQRGGENGRAPTQDLQPSGYAPSDFSTKAFAGELRAMGRSRPLAVADPGETGALSPKGASGMVQLSPDSQTPMGDQLRRESDARALEAILAKQKIDFTKRLIEDPGFLEKGLIREKGEQERQSVVASQKAAVEARQEVIDQQAKARALQALYQEVQQQVEGAKAEFAGNPENLRLKTAAIHRIAAAKAAQIQQGIRGF